MTLQFPFGLSIFFQNRLWHCQLCVASAQQSLPNPTAGFGGSPSWPTLTDRQLSLGLVNCPHCCFTDGQPRNESSNYLSGWAETYLRVWVSHKALGKQLWALPTRLPGMELVLLLKSSSSTAFVGLVCLLSSSCGPQVQLVLFLWASGGVFSYYGKRERAHFMWDEHRKYWAFLLALTLCFLEESAPRLTSLDKEVLKGFVPQPLKPKETFIFMSGAWGSSPNS